MLRKNKIALLISSLLIIAGIYVYIQIDIPQHKNISSIETKLSYQANDLVFSFISDEKVLQHQLSGKIIEVEGIVKEVSFLNNRNTIILETTNKTSGIICDFNPQETNDFKKVVAGDKVKIKGICKGFLKDVVLLNCYLISNQANE